MFQAIERLIRRTPERHVFKPHAIVAPEGEERERLIEDIPGSSNPIKLWRDRMTQHAPAHTENWGSGFYAEWRAEGEAIISEVMNLHGEEMAMQILSAMGGVSLTTQLRLLRLAQTNDAPFLRDALEAVYPEGERGKRKYKYDHYIQEDHYRQILQKALELKFPDQETASFVERFHVPKTASGLDMLDIALLKGPNFMLDAFALIPPSQVSKDNFERRLKLEREAREKGAPLAEREYRFVGQVQDVGFRGFTRGRADVWGITGFARNELDGSVTVLVQGPPEILSAFIADLDRDIEEKLKVHAIRIVLREEEIKDRLDGFQTLEDPRMPL